MCGSLQRKFHFITTRFQISFTGQTKKWYIIKMYEFYSLRRDLFYVVMSKLHMSFISCNRFRIWVLYSSCNRFRKQKYAVEYNVISSRWDSAMSKLCIQSRCTHFSHSERTFALQCCQAKCEFEINILHCWRFITYVAKYNPISSSRDSGKIKFDV